MNSFCEFLIHSKWFTVPLLVALTMYSTCRVICWGAENMFYKMIEKKMESWYKSPSCTVKQLIDYIISTNQMRDAQVEAIKTYLFLKISCCNKPLYRLFIDGAFNNLDISELELKNSVKDYLETNPAAAALYEYATLQNDAGEQVSEKIEKQIKNNPETIDYKSFFSNAFYNVSYSDYLFSLPMGAGKTYLMAAFIYLDLYFATNEPLNKSFAHNFVIFAPSGLKSSVVPSLKTIQNFDPSWIIPEPSATNIKRMISFEVLDQTKAANKSNQTKNPNVQKIASHQPLVELFGLVAVTNAEKVVLDRIKESKGQVSLFDDSDDEKDRQANELRNLLGKLPSMSIFIDEVHHAVSDEIKLRAVVNKWIETNHSINSVIGFSGTPYLDKAEKILVTDNLKVSTSEISNIVYYYPLINGVGNFLKKPVIKVTQNATSEEIIENGVRNFLDEYKDKVYANGLTAKLGIYCGTIRKLEEVVYPIVSRVVSEYELPNSCILKFHRGDKQFPAPADSQLEFDILDSTLSKTRIVLLVQIGKEGWDCRSLTGIILSQESECPTNMVLQTSCRCLRQVDRGYPESALVCLNYDNAQKLEMQLEKEHHISLSEFQNADNHKIVLKRFNRTEYLKLPKVEFYQLKIKYDSIVTEKKNVTEEIQKSIDNAVVDYSYSYVTDLEGKKNSHTVDDSEKGVIYTTFYMWINEIAKESFGFVTISDLKKYEMELRTVFETITYEKDGIRFFSSKYDKKTVNANIRKAFSDLRDYTSSEEVFPETASLLNITKFTNEIHTEEPTSYIPDQKMVDNIILDDAGKLKIDKKTQKLIELAKETGQSEFAEKLIAEQSSHKNKNRIYHYLPYHTDSSFESKFYEEISNYSALTDLDLEVYYNGDRALTDFKILCYKKRKNSWSYIGRYTPDFLVIQRRDGKIYKSIIVETKGEIYSHDEAFNDKRFFMENFFIKHNNEAFGYKKFDYLYLEDTLSDLERINKTYSKIKEFFEDGGAR